jgi:hypothetical protein
MNNLNYTMQVLNEVFPDAQRETWEQKQVDEARARYESTVVEEARAIVEGRSSEPASKEHLRVVLDWLDGTGYQFNQETTGVAQDGNTPPF